MLISLFPLHFIVIILGYIAIFFGLIAVCISLSHEQIEKLKKLVDRKKFLIEFAPEYIESDSYRIFLNSYRRTLPFREIYKINEIIIASLLIILGILSYEFLTSGVNFINTLPAFNSITAPNIIVQITFFLFLLLFICIYLIQGIFFFTLIAGGLIALYSIFILIRFIKHIPFKIEIWGDPQEITLLKEIWLNSLFIIFIPQIIAWIVISIPIVLRSDSIHGLIDNIFPQVTNFLGICIIISIVVILIYLLCPLWYLHTYIKKFKERKLHEISNYLNFIDNHYPCNFFDSNRLLIELKKKEYLEKMSGPLDYKIITMILAQMISATSLILKLMDFF